MYVPSSFRETNADTLFEFIKQHSFGMLVSQVDELPFVSHLPFLVDRETGDHGRLIGHMARANPQWIDAAGDVLVVFSGPHAYISPTWYESDKVVPTWNYVAVHVYGTLQIIDDEESLIGIVRDYVDTYEKSMPQPWVLDTLSGDFIHALVQQIVGFEILVTRIEGKWKLSQNHTVERRQKVIGVLGEADDDDSRKIAALMQQTLSPDLSKGA